MGSIFLSIGLALVLGTLVGWATHWLMHQPWTGSLYRGHSAHHRAYTPNKLFSREYRYVKSDSAYIFVPVITLVLAGVAYKAHRLGVTWLGIGIGAVFSILTGLAHDYLHRVMHLCHHPWHRFPWVRRLQALHIGHHRKVGTNLGILWFGWDRLFGTFRK